MSVLYRIVSYDNSYDGLEHRQVGQREMLVEVEPDYEAAGFRMYEDSVSNHTDEYAHPSYKEWKDTWTRKARWVVDVALTEGDSDE